jgi:hypothetical protein
MYVYFFIIGQHPMSKAGQGSSMGLGGLMGTDTWPCSCNARVRHAEELPCVRLCGPCPACAQVAGLSYDTCCP